MFKWWTNLKKWYKTHGTNEETQWMKIAVDRKYSEWNYGEWKLLWMKIYANEKCHN